MKISHIAAAAGLFIAALGVGGTAEARKLTTTPGWWHAAVGGDVLVIGTDVWRGGSVVTGLRSYATDLPYRAAPVLERVTDRRLPSAVLYPTGFVAGSRLPTPAPI